MTIRTGPVPHGGGRATAAAQDRSRADAVLAAVAIVLLMQVWRVQELFPILAVPGLPIVATLGAGLLFFLGRNSGRALGGLDRPLVAAVLGILVLVALSIPGSLYPRYSFEFLLKDYLRTVVLMLLVAAGVWGRLALLAILACLMVTLVKTGSRGGFLGFVAVAVYLLVWFDGVAPAKRWAAVALPVLLLVALGGGGYFERIQTLLHPDTDYNWSGNSETGRMEVWKRGIGYMLDRPLLGVGAQAFGVAEGTLAPEAARLEEYGKGFKWSTAHNAFVEIGAEIGVLGLLLFVALLVGAFRVLARARRGPQREAAVLARALDGSLVGFVVTACFLSQAYSAYFYTLLGMTLGLARLRDAAQVPPAHAGPGTRRPGTLPWSRRPAADA